MFSDYFLLLSFCQWLQRTKCRRYKYNGNLIFLPHFLGRRAIPDFSPKMDPIGRSVVMVATRPEGSEQDLLILRREEKEVVGTSKSVEKWGWNAVQTIISSPKHDVENGCICGQHTVYSLDLA